MHAYKLQGEKKRFLLPHFTFILKKITDIESFYCCACTQRNVFMVGGECQQIFNPAHQSITDTSGRTAEAACHRFLSQAKNFRVKLSMLSSIPLFIIILLSKEYFYYKLEALGTFEGTIQLNMEKNQAHIRKFYYLTFIFLKFNVIYENHKH